MERYRTSFLVLITDLLIVPCPATPRFFAKSGELLENKSVEFFLNAKSAKECRGVRKNLKRKHLSRAERGELPLGLVGVSSFQNGPLRGVFADRRAATCRDIRLGGWTGQHDRAYFCRTILH
jgi:hypothetical protein